MTDYIDAPGTGPEIRIKPEKRWDIQRAGFSLALTLNAYKVTLHWSILIGFGLTAFNLGIAAAVLIASVAYLSVLLHEFGHLLVANRYGPKSNHIILWAFGGAALSPLQTLSPKHRFLTYVAGPAVNLVLVLCLLGMIAVLGDTIWLIWPLAINTVILVFNLLPIFPLDGGGIILSFFEMAGMGHRKATLFVAWGGIAVAGLLLPICMFTTPIIGLILLACVVGNFGMIRSGRAYPTNPPPC